VAGDLCGDRYPACLVISLPAELSTRPLPTLREREGAWRDPGGGAERCVLRGHFEDGGNLLRHSVGHDQLLPVVELEAPVARCGEVASEVAYTCYVCGLSAQYEQVLKDVVEAGFGRAEKRHGRS